MVRKRKIHQVCLFVESSPFGGYEFDLSSEKKLVHGLFYTMSPRKLQCVRASKF